MARRALSICSTPGCPQYTRGGRCTDCQTTAEQRRGTSSQRGYGSQHRTDFRQAVIARDPSCVCTTTSHDHAEPCGEPSKHADHYPRDRRELVAAGENPNDPRHGRGLCGPCHSAETARHQPGGWAAGQG
ncbi:holin [Streptomyces sp. ID05-04B]|uniref:holin n=1 Tax=Streptomyces sp. ID05-04B TaxID=3028661 RepID=UPI0029C3D6BD|nr:holin [Streptomyces sp. ID05-04B]MDX5569247.1 holin [Streptomyces sp. ID05-04B]